MPNDTLSQTTGHGTCTSPQTIPLVTSIDWPTALRRKHPTTARFKPAANHTALRLVRRMMTCSDADICLGANRSSIGRWLARL